MTYFKVTILIRGLQVEFDTLEEGMEAVRKNDAWGLMHFTRNYTTMLMERVNFTRGASDEAIDLSEVDIWMDMSSMCILGVKFIRTSEQ